VRHAVIAILIASIPAAASAKPWRAVMSPGDVSEAHEKVEDSCERCHLPFKGVPDEKCFVCHKEIDRREKTGKGFHASVRSQACIDCHADHGGRSSDLTKAKARESFDHKSTGFDLTGVHAKVACDGCHKKPIAEVSRQCGTCHEDPHKGSLGGACQKCHEVSGSESAKDPWKRGVKTVAAHKVSMDGGHAKLGCEDCHKGGAHMSEKVACGDCHEQEHGGTTAACDVCHTVAGFKPAKFEHSVCTCIFPGKHQTFECLACHPNWQFAKTPTRCSGCHEKLRKHEPLGECSLCHSALSWKRKDAFDHNKRSKFALAGSHLDIDCTHCHKTAGQFRGAPTKCEGCHADQGMKAHGDFGGCAKCHTVEAFEKPTFDHASTGFPLSGRHEKLGCQDCHAQKMQGYPKKAKPVGAMLNGSPRLASTEVQDALRIATWLAGQTVHTQEGACVHCHEDAHQGQVGSDCASCHATETWTPSTFDRARHEQTKLPLRGKHQEVECRLCHAGGQLKDLPLQCSACHLDPHRGKLGAECARCHNEVGFRPVEGFDHASTGFALVGPHARVDCKACHEGARGRAMAESEETPTCATCHQPGHGKELGADCLACHPLAERDGKPITFSSARGMPFFEHAKTGFPLERRHRAQRCGSCHPAKGPPPTPICASCHLDPHGGQLGRECADCHRADRWRLARFDHDRAGWPLRGRHFLTPCAKCHTSQRWVGLTTDCYDCHALDAGRAKMTVGQHPFGPLDCRDCHTSFWRW
jgi:hypothetical protein